MGTRSENRAGERARGCIMRAARGGAASFPISWYQVLGTSYLSPEPSVLRTQSSLLDGRPRRHGAAARRISFQGQGLR